MDPLETGERAVEITVVVPVVEPVDDLAWLFEHYAVPLRETKRPFEFVFVLDEASRHWIEPLRELKRDHPEVILVVLGGSLGEAAALKAGAAQARGSVIVTLASRLQVEGGGIREMLAELDAGSDLVVICRQPRRDARFNRLQSRVFNGLLRLLTGSKFRDVTCGSRAMRAEVFDELHLYGNFHRFIPILARDAGFEVEEVEVSQSPKDARMRLLKPTGYLTFLLDVLTLFFLTRFARKPLRFFGTLGAGIFGVGFAISAYLALYRLLGFGGVADRPLLLLGILLIVFGVQSISIGLVGEIVIFTLAREKEYRVEKVL